MQDAEELFGPGRTWESLYRYVHAYQRQRFHTASTEFIEDCASEGFDRAVRKNWNNQPHSTPEERAHNWNKAKRIARLESQAWAAQERERYEVPVSVLVPSSMSGEDHQDFMDALFGESTWHSPAHVVEERDLAARARAVLQELSRTEHWDRWLKDLVQGVPDSVAAKAAGLVRTAIVKRRTRGINQIRPVLAKHGLVPKEDA